MPDVPSMAPADGAAETGVLTYPEVRLVSDDLFEWRRLGSIEPRCLGDARLQCHHAAQIVSSAGVTYLPAAADDSHTNMGWRDDLGALAGRVVNPGRPLQAALRFSDLTLLLLDDSGEVSLERALDGRTLDGGYDWLARAIDSHIGHPPAKALTRPVYEMPPHPAASGARFTTVDGAAFEELSRWYSNAHGLLEQFRGKTPRASEVRCWPHHFDIAALIEMDKGAAGENPRTIGVGLSPGDGSYGEPYFYVSPYPYPENPKPAGLESGGTWHTEGWFGAVLIGSKLAATASADEQRRRAVAFVESAVGACGRLLGEAAPQ